MKTVAYKDLLLDARDPQAVWDVLRALCERQGAVQDLTIICGTRPARQAICLVRMGEPADAQCIAHSLGTVAFGASEVLFEFELAPGFACPKRQPGGPSPATCVCQS